MLHPTNRRQGVGSVDADLRAASGAGQCFCPVTDRARRSRSTRGPRADARWRVAAGLAACLFAAPVRAQTEADYHARADLGIQSFLLKFWDGDDQYLRGDYPDTGGLTGYWTYANAWQAVMDAVERTGGRHYTGLIETLYLGQDQRGWYSGWYDDECWMTLALVRAFDLTGDPVYLARAEMIYTDVMGGWDDATGGVWWDRSHTQKATASNAGAALAGALLYQRTRNGAYLAFSQEVYAFWYTTMVDHRTYQVCDHITPDGTKVWWQFTYNEGLMVGADVELYRATHTTDYLDQAHAIATRMIRFEVTSTPYGGVLYDGPNVGGCGGDCHQFKGPAYRYLMALYQLDTSQTTYAGVLQASADAVWNLARHAPTTVFAFNWAGPPQSSVDLNQDNAACTALNLYAAQAGAYPPPTDPPNRYEAEDAVLHRIGLAADDGTFTGWGYAAARHGDGEEIRFDVDCPVPGPREIALRYAAGAGGASRQIVVNDVELVANLGFPATGSWGRLAVVRVPCVLPAGPSTLSVRYVAQMGSHNDLNLDHLVVEDPASPQITNLGIFPDGQVALTWSAVSGQTYHVESSEAPPSWTPVAGPITATGPTAASSTPTPVTPATQFRVVTP